MSAGDFAWLLFGLACIAGLTIGISLAAADDIETWTNDGHGCYLRVVEHRSVWWSGSPSPDLRRTYCPEATQ